jgi:hypothetical protein
MADIASASIDIVTDGDQGSDAIASGRALGRHRLAQILDDPSGRVIDIQDGAVRSHVEAAIRACGKRSQPAPLYGRT